MFKIYFYTLEVDCLLRHNRGEKKLIVIFLDIKDKKEFYYCLHHNG